MQRLSWDDEADIEAVNALAVEEIAAAAAATASVNNELNKEEDEGGRDAPAALDGSDDDERDVAAPRLWDTVICADCCYSEGSVPLLINTLKKLCASGTNVIMAHDDRNETATQLLEVAMKKTFDSVKQIPLKKINLCMPSKDDPERFRSDGVPVEVKCGTSMHLYVLGGCGLVESYADV
mgnify:CR=1 FL=1